MASEFVGQVAILKLGMHLASVWLLVVALVVQEKSGMKP